MNTQRESEWKKLYTSEDWWSVWMGFIIFLFAILGWFGQVPKLGKWTFNPADMFIVREGTEAAGTLAFPILLLLVTLGLLMTVAVYFMRGKPGRFLGSFTVVFILAIVSYLFANQVQVKAYGLGYAFWALLIGLLISNTIGTPKWLMAGVRTELYIKTGLVLLGAEVLFGKILQLGGPGLFVAWLVTPTVIFFMYWFGVRGLKLASKSLVIIIAAATSVCGVSAAIATCAAARGKKEELTLAVGMTLIFTVLMMIFMPMIIKGIGMDVAVGAAWMGGTIDSTGAVVAAGAFLGKQAEQIAAVVKMIQNVLIGVVAFFVALYWTTSVDRDPSGPKPNAMEIWYRFPKFVVGFVAASLLFSFVLVPAMGQSVVENDIIKFATKSLRGWLFCMAFVSIGLESNFKDLASQMVGGKPLILYITGQSFNVVLTVFAAWLAFGGVLWPKPF
ncbi:putative sulfate exporter family transporter [bacterium]|nr:putative sulfate exporter family transporter [bacterium]